MKITILLIFICVLVTFFCQAYPVFTENYLVYSGNSFLQGNLWTSITSLFVHSGLVHLIGNMVFLYVFGRVVEEEAGTKIVLTAFFIGGFGALATSTVYYGVDVSMVGASGAIFTLAAAAMLIKPLKSSLFFLFMPLGLVAILYFIYNILAVVLDVGGNVGYVAHVTGFLIGVPYGIAFSEGKWAKNLIITGLLLVTFLASVWLIQNLTNLM